MDARRSETIEIRERWGDRERVVSGKETEGTREVRRRDEGCRDQKAEGAGDADDAPDAMYGNKEETRSSCARTQSGGGGGDDATARRGEPTAVSRRVCRVVPLGPRKSFASWR